MLLIRLLLSYKNPSLHKMENSRKPNSHASVKALPSNS